MSSLNLPKLSLSNGEDIATAINRRKSGLHWARLPALTPRPQTVVDVGASGGTVGLYKVFERSKFYLIDALEENRASLERQKEKFDATIIISAVGATPGVAQFHVPEQGKTGKSSFLKRAGAFSDDRMIPRTVEVSRLDDIIPEIPGSIGFKIDAEGFEREVLLGAPRILAQSAWVVCEISMSPRFVGDPLFAGVYPILDAAGFAFRDFIDLTRQGAGDLRRIDAVFVRNELVNYARERREARQGRMKSVLGGLKRRLGGAVKRG